MNESWRKKELWTRLGEGFCVEVSHHLAEHSDYDGPHRWCVYVYVYPTHPHFAKFEGDTMFQEAARIMPLHGGPSLLTWHVDNHGKIGSVKVGADYDHLHDEHYRQMQTAEEAHSVFADADELYLWMSERSTPPAPPTKEEQR